MMDFNQARIADMDRLIRSEIGRDNLAGANLLLLKDGRTLHRASYGMADKEKQIPMTDDTIFRIFSMTKPVICAAAMLLVERGVIDLSDPVEHYLPGFHGQQVFLPGSTQTVPASRAVRLSDLLNMTSGLAYPDDCTSSGKAVAALFDEMTAAQDAGVSFSTVQLANRLGQIPLAFQPGAHWMYGTSADVLGAVIEVASGMRLSSFLKQELFEPLDMKDTDFYVPDAKKNRFAELYRCSEMSAASASALIKNNPERTSSAEISPEGAAPLKTNAGDAVQKPAKGGVVDTLCSFSVYQSDKRMHIAPQPGKNLGMEGYDHAPSFESGGAGLVSTIGDYAHFATMLLQGGVWQDRRILGKNTVSFLCSPQLSDTYAPDLNWDSLRGYRYGNLMRHLADPAAAGTNADMGEFGWDGWCGTYFTVSPKSNFIMLYFIQRCDAGCNEITRRLRNIAYSLV
ncbi:MAG: beta-lactamase family protein [Lachnospiraceae bacterium]|nr:beta-lactamase family protein [Lachnospiraceae bacterium]